MGYRERISEIEVTSALGKGVERMGGIENSYAVQERYFRKNYLKYMPENRSACIVDLGCGMGHFLNFARKSGYKNVVGCDASKECVDFCKKRKFEVVQKSIFTFLKGKENCYDTIVFNDVIEHLYKDEIIEILDLIYTALKPGGGGYY